MMMLDTSASCELKTAKPDPILAFTRVCSSPNCAMIIMMMTMMMMMIIIIIMTMRMNTVGLCRISLAELHPILLLLHVNAGFGKRRLYKGDDWNDNGER